jgi:hypothetical protein
MTDPVTIGTLAASTLAMASDEAVKGSVGEAVKDAYKALKNKIAQWAGTGVDALEKAPASAARQSVVAEAVDGQSPEEQALVKALAAELVAALKSERGSPVGLDISKLEALDVQLGAITVMEGTGVRMKEVKTDIFTVDQVNVGSPPGKTDR